MSTDNVTCIEIAHQELNDILAHVKASLPSSDYEQIKKLINAYVALQQLIQKKNMSISRLRKMIFGSKTEKTSNVLKGQKESQEGQASETATTKENLDNTVEESQSAKTDNEPQTNNEVAGKNKPDKQKSPPKGHGRIPASAYHGAKQVKVPHEKLKSGDPCPLCPTGKVYLLKKPAVIVRVTGSAPLPATVYHLERLRCNLCGEVFVAETPSGVGPDKYDERAVSMAANLKYGCGMPFNRLEGLQGSMGIPLPSSTQWENLRDRAEQLKSTFGELIRQAAQADLLHNDDTWQKILELMKENQEKEKEPVRSKKTDKDIDGERSSERRGMFTTGIIAIKGKRKIALFFTGRNHAGENLAEVLKLRAKELGPPIQMSDALSRNLPKTIETIAANRIPHGRRKFVDVKESFPQEVKHVLNIIGQVYENDDYTKKHKTTPEQRLQYHQEHSKPLMDDLKKWFKVQFKEKLVEPNSGLGEAINYMENHWEKLTCFLRVAGAPLDNNIVERALKKAILHRKNAMFFKTLNGAHVGDIYMSLIHTAELAGANPFDYLTELLCHADKLAAQPDLWMPWNYRETLESLSETKTA